MDRNVSYWFAVHTRSRHEKQVDSFLKEKRIDAFLPLIKTPSRRKDRVKFVDLPLFPGYLFVNILFGNVYDVITTRGVTRIVGTDNLTPIPIPEKQVNDIKLLVNSNIKLDTYKYLATGTRIRIKSGPLAGVEGILLKKKTNYRVVVSVDLLNTLYQRMAIVGSLIINILIFLAKIFLPRTVMPCNTQFVSHFVM